MKTKFLSLLILFFIAKTVFSQTNLNNYKYIIVPNTFDFLKEKDHYQLNSLTKFLFEKYGFQALMEGDLYPNDLMQNRCLDLKANIKKDSGIFKTKLLIELKDCNDKIVFTSQLGESREKDYKIAYNEALRNAFKSIEDLNYTYQPSYKIITLSKPESATTTVDSLELLQLKQEIRQLKQQKVNDAVKTNQLTVSQPITPNTVAKKTITEDFINTLYAQEIENGFQLVDNSPKVIYKIIKTSIPNVFIIENKNAMLYKKDTNWVIDYYENDVLKQQVINIKF